MNKKQVQVIRNGSAEPTLAPFDSIKKGDIIFVQREAIVCSEDAHKSEDPSYEGFLLYGQNGESWFPEDLDGDPSSSHSTATMRPARDTLFALKNKDGLYFSGFRLSGLVPVWSKLPHQSKLYTRFEKAAEMRDDIRLMEDEASIYTMFLTEGYEYNPDIDY